MDSMHSLVQLLKLRSGSLPSRGVNGEELLKKRSGHLIIDEIRKMSEKILK